LLVKRIASGIERSPEQRAGFRTQTAAHDKRAAILLVEVQAASRVLASGVADLGLTIDVTPATHDLLNLSSGPAAGDGKQPLLGPGRRDACDGPHFGVGDLAARQGLCQTR
jgi:hypothetical protein